MDSFLDTAATFLAFVCVICVTVIVGALTYRLVDWILT